MRLFLACFRLFISIAWWDQVMDTPEDSKIIVFKRGTFIGLNGEMLIGGQFWPNSTLGLILLWKYAQKNDRKKKISDVINKIILIFNPNITFEWWNPWFLASRVISRHHIYATIMVTMLDKIIVIGDFICIQITKDEVIQRPKNYTNASELLNEFRLYAHPECKDTVNHQALMDTLNDNGKVSFMILIDLQDNEYCILHS